jgi:hypothetical protein
MEDGVSPLACRGLHLSPHSASKTRVDALMSGRGRRACAAGEGDSPQTERSESPPHPNPLSASGEREPTELVATTAIYNPASG